MATNPEAGSSAGSGGGGGGADVVSGAGDAAMVTMKHEGTMLDGPGGDTILKKKRKGPKEPLLLCPDDRSAITQDGYEFYGSISNWPKIHFYAYLAEPHPRAAQIEHDIYKGFKAWEKEAQKHSKESDEEAET